ncbi:MAG: type II secretion system F family protein [Thermofilum sp.]
MKLPQKALSTVLQQIGDMLEAGIPIVTALSVAAEASASSRVREALRAVSVEVQSGMPLHEALMPFVDSGTASMIRAGEESGKLPEVLKRIATELKEAHEFKLELLSSMLYPAFVLVLMGAVIGYMLLFMIPKLAPLMAEMKNPPRELLMVAAASAKLKQSWKTLLGTALLATGGTLLMFKSQGAREKLEELLAGAPLIKGVLKAYWQSRFCSIMSLALSSGLDLLSCITLACEGSGSVLWRRMTDRIVSGVMEGRTLASSLPETLVHPQVLAYVRVGEESGRLEEYFLRASEIMRHQLQTTIRSALKMVEPALLLVCAGGVGIIVVMFMIPIYQGALSSF